MAGVRKRWQGDGCRWCVGEVLITGAAKLRCGVLEGRFKRKGIRALYSPSNSPRWRLEGQVGHPRGG